MNVALLFLPLILGSPGAPEKGRDGGLWFEGRRIPFSKLPADLPASLRALLEKERPFAEERGLRIYAKAKAPVVVISEWAESQTLKHFEDAEALAADFTRFFPEPREPAPLADEEIDGADPSTPFPLFLIQTMPVYTALAEKMEAEHEYLKEQGWAARAANLQGFHLYRPRIVVCLSGTYGDPRHWVLHELVHVMAYPRYGRQPFWVEEGMAWFVEDAILKGVFAFCYRSNFLWDAEKSGWSNDFAGLLRKDKPPSVLQLASMRPGTYTAGDSGVKDPRALLAYGFIAFCSNERRSEFLAMMSAFAKDAAEVGEFEASYEVPVETQRKILEATFGPDLDKDLASFAGRIGKEVPKPKTPSKAERYSGG